MLKVSVIIPVYNVEKYLEKCLESLINQSLKEIEFICINDGSTDNSLEILNRYASLDNRFTIISQKNSGQGIARNKGIEVARGEYIGFVDPDDWVEENALEIVYNCAKENDADIVEFNFKKTYEDTQKVEFYHNKILSSKVFNREKIPLYLFSNEFAVWNKLYRSELLHKNNLQFSKGKHGEDHYFTIAARSHAIRVVYCKEALYNYRIRKTSITQTISNESLEMAYFMKDIKDLLIKENIYPTVQKAFKKYAAGVLKHHYMLLQQEKQLLFKSILETYLSKQEYNCFLNRVATNNSHWIENLFSIRNETILDKKYKVITIFWKKIKIRRNK